MKDQSSPVKQHEPADRAEPVTAEVSPPPGETCPKCGNFRGHTVRCYEQTEKDRVFRNDVLEEAAAICVIPSRFWHETITAQQCAARIRALKVSTLAEQP